MNDFRNLGTDEKPLWVRPRDVKSITRTMVKRWHNGHGMQTWQVEEGKSTISIDGGHKWVVNKEPEDVLRCMFVTSTYAVEQGQVELGSMYPTRARIIDVTGVVMMAAEQEMLRLRTPEASRPHIGKEGLAELINGQVRITLDDGDILWGSECWWEPIA